MYIIIEYITIAASVVSEHVMNRARYARITHRTYCVSC